ncbi:MAG: trigger factor [Firmicutes bacterium]|nr:trigger factor [Bacillota bacterium]
MQTELKKLDNNKVELKVEVEAEKVNDALEKAYRKLRRNVTIPGFRKGKAPRVLVERYLGSAALYEEAINRLFPEAYSEALEKEGVEPIDDPELDLEQFEENKPFIFKATVEVKPEVKLGQYKGLKATKVIEKVDEVQVNMVLEQMRERQAELVTTDKTVVDKGDYVLLDFEGFVDGKPFSGGSGKDVILEVGAGRFLPDFEEGLVGAKVGETAEIEVSFPEDYGADFLQGKTAIFKVNVKEIKEKKLPELDDEFAKDVSEHETLAELKEEIKEVLAKDNERKATRNLEDELVRQVRENSQVEVPEKMVERQINRKINDLSMRLNQQGYTLEAYLEAENLTGEELREEFREGAREDVTTGLILEAIGKAEKITVSEEEYENRLREIFNASDEDLPKLKARLEHDGADHRIKDQLLGGKILQFLVDNADVTVEYKDPEVSETVDKVEEEEQEEQEATEQE